MSRFPSKNIDYTNRDYQGFKTMLIENLHSSMPEYTDTSETDAGIVILESLANGLDILSLYLDVTANDVLLPSTQDRETATIIAQCLGYSPYNQTASEYEQIFKLDSIKEYDVVIEKGTSVRTSETDESEAIFFETMDTLTIPAGYLGDEQEDEEYLFKVRIKQGESVIEDVIGTADGTALQSFELNYTDVLTDELVIMIDEVQGNDDSNSETFEWKRVDNFIDADSNSRVYLTSVDDFGVCTVSFGDGVRGKIPYSSVNGVVATYMVGGGETSNVELNTITEMEVSIPGISETTNVKQLVFGADRESLESIKINAVGSFRSRDRMVTLNDYSDLLRINFREIKDVVAEVDSGDVKNVIIYYIMDQIDEETAYDFSDISTEVQKFINERKMVGTTFYLEEYTAEEVDITATIYVTEGYDANQVKAEVESYIQDIVFAFGNFTFNDSLIVSDFENDVKNNVEGILSFRTSALGAIVSPSNTYNVLTVGDITLTTVVV